MSMFKKLFGKSSRLESVRRFVQQERWAEALSLGDSLDRTSLEPAGQAELENLLAAAGDALAELNLNEGEACLRAGDSRRAAEHFALAADQARGEELVARTRRALARTESISTPSVQTVRLPQACGTDCGTACGPAMEDEPFIPEEADLEESARLELILASYPSDLAGRYESISDSFRRAFLLAHEGREREALEAFEAVPPPERDDLFHFELGALLARLGEAERGRDELERALACNPRHLLALESAVNLALTRDELAEAENRLQAMLQEDLALAFCHGRLALLRLRQGKPDAALDHCRKALETGAAEAETLVLTAGLLEQAGRLDEAEAVLMRISGGGCSGGDNVPLAEFWLRCGRNPERALEVFKKAARQDPDNPRWILRIAQAYLACGWKREGIPLLEKALADPRLEPDLRQEGNVLLDSSR